MKRFPFNLKSLHSVCISYMAAASIPRCYRAVLVHGFVEELVVNEDPEYQWIDRIRTPRASNEARQRLISLMSGKAMYGDRLLMFVLRQNSFVLSYEPPFNSVALCHPLFRGAAEKNRAKGTGDGWERSGGLLAVFRPGGRIGSGGQGHRHGLHAGQTQLWECPQHQHTHAPEHSPCFQCLQFPFQGWKGVSMNPQHQHGPDSCASFTAKVVCENGKTLLLCA